ncbi:ATPase domain-containing protein [Roseomonas xinghualingensis]|uniref:ATPase domain-containing protein n=1 Tax=Roseomonas xinghualingensis TaxID=2986475 RepID=UPI0021F21FCE|nr:ATPase domain-containing protein [Roseomonas sp. SXEYE001]
MQRITTGVPGLDTVLGGGLLRGRSYIIQGSPGAGKTILANQACFHRAAEGDQALFVTLLSESHDTLLQHLSTLDFYEPHHVPQSVYYISALGTLQREGLDGVARLLREETASRKASLLVFDGLLNVRDATGSAPDLKRFLHTVQTQAAFAGCTILMLTSAQLDDQSPEHTVVDGVIELGNMVTGVRTVRRLQVRKFRGGASLEGLHQFQIDQRGVTIFPRLEAQYALPSMEDEASSPEDRAGTGIQDLDAIMGGGGIPRNSATLVFGPSGIGKTTLGLHFLAASQPDEPALHYGFYENPKRLLSKATALGLDLRSQVGKGQLEIMWHPPGERLLDAMGQGLLDAVARRGVKRLFIDGLGAFERAAIHLPRLVEYFTALTSELRARGVTTVATWESRNIVGGSVETPAPELSSIVDNLVYMRFVEWRARMHRLMAVVKVRDSAFDQDLHHFCITKHGLEFVPQKDGADALLSGFAHRSPAAAGEVPSA